MIYTDKNNNKVKEGDSIHYGNKVLKIENVCGVLMGVEYLPNGRISKTKVICKIDFTKAEKL